MKHQYIYLLILIVFIISCSENVIEPNGQEPLEVNIRMEVQILDSTYQLYARPFTIIYFTTYKLKSDDEIENFDQSDTTSCRNGWGVKELNYIINNKEEKIIIGAACDNYNGANYREFIINFEEAERRIDSTGTANLIKTFAIYYK